MSELSVLLIGDVARAEFRDASALIEDTSRTITTTDVDEAARLLAGGEYSPELIVLAQARPGQISQQQVERLQLAAPLARLIVLLGSQCEGETRTGQPWPGVRRAFWYQWPARWRAELERRRQGGLPSWGQPPTASDEELLLSSLWPRRPCHGLVAIHTPHFDTAATLAEACGERGMSTVWVQPHRPSQLHGARAALWDAGCLDSEELGRLARFRQRIDGAPIGVLADFPRVQHREQLMAAGATFIVGRPFLAEELFVPLEKALEEGESVRQREVGGNPALPGRARVGVGA
ncbi:MAG: hypothetical protein IID44_05590 [Planctomycetes bacterium]|nr:hypothetical protein [Planctomycetota bacterium]